LTVSVTLFLAQLFMQVRLQEQATSVAEFQRLLAKQVQMESLSSQLLAEMLKLSSQQ